MTGRGAGTLALLGLACSLWCAAARAHDDLHAQIAEVSRCIAADPEDAGLYALRGALHRIHRDFDQALADFALALQLDPDQREAELGQARLLIDLDRLDEARRSLDRVLGRWPGESAARILRARLCLRLGELPRARQDYEQLVAAMPRTEHYLGLADVLGRQGEHAAALATMDAGIQRLGAVPGLVDRALELETSAGHFDAALERTSALLAAATRKEKWYALQGDILLQAGRLAPARAAYEKALEALHALNPRQRSSALIVALEARVTARLKRLSSVVPS